MIQCDECAKRAVTRVRWGQNESQNGKFCVSHAASLWGKVAGLVARGICFWIQEEIVQPSDQSEGE